MAFSKVADRLKAKAAAAGTGTGATGTATPRPTVAAGADPNAPIEPGGFETNPGERMPGGTEPIDPTRSEPRMPRIISDEEAERQRTQPGAAQPSGGWGLTTDSRTGKQVDLSDAALDPWIMSEFAKWGYTPNQAEIEQWRGYLRRPENGGGGTQLGPDPYWAMRIGYHARGEDYEAQFAKPLAGLNFGALPSGPDPGPMAVGGGSAGGGGSFQLSQAASGAAPSPMDAKVNEAILKLLETPRDRSAEWLKNTPEAQAGMGALQRSEERQRAATAQQASVEGWGNSGAFDTEISGLKQARGEAGAELLGAIAAQYVDRDREDLKQGIQFALSAGQFDKAQALQRELAALEAQVQREGIAVNREGMLMDDRYRYASLGENSRQFNLGYGLDLAGLQLNANRDAFLAAYGG